MRTYTEDEVADIIARAAERQAASPRAEAPGLTLDEIERLGVEAGLNVDDLRAAAAEVNAAGRTLSRQASHTATHVVVERWIDGPLTSEAWEDAVDVLREQVGASSAAMLGMAANGTTQQVGRAFEWTHTSGMGIQTTVTASPRGDRTRLRLTQLVGLANSRTEGALYGLIPAGLVAAIATAAVGSSGAFPLVVFATMVLSFLVALAVAAPTITALDRRWRAKKLDTLDALADDVSEVLAAPRPEALDGTTEALPDGAPLRGAFEAIVDETRDGAQAEPARRRDRS